MIGGYVALMWASLQAYSSDSQSGPIALGLVSGGTFVAGVIVMIIGLVLKGRQDAEWLERNPKPVRRRRR